MKSASQGADLSSTAPSGDPPRTSPLELCVHDLIAARAQTTPEAVALISDGKTTTYAQLNARANQLSRYLRASGVGPDVLAGICMNRSAEMVVAMMGILKAGGAYVPLDPCDPAERQSFELQDSGTNVLVTTDSLAKKLPCRGRSVVRMDSDWAGIERESQENLRPAARLANLAYVIYTSGSTGRPKGVMVTHSGLLNYLNWAARIYGEAAQTSALVHSSISFDLTITGLYTPLMVGGVVELLPDDLGVEALVSALRQPQVRGLVKITPAHLELLSHQLRPNEAAGKVKLFVIGGENLVGETLRFWREISPSTRLINEYGPTETVVGCCAHEVLEGDPFTGSVPIGKAIDNTQPYILDSQRVPVQNGVEGELYIGGAGVARGYLNRADLTQDHFLPDPFANKPGARMYKTGDLALCREDGTLEYKGRLDDQVKIRGYRVELGEIGVVVGDHPGVSQCVAVARDNEHGRKRLVAYVVPRAKGAVTAKELREFVKERLPEYMIPARFVFLEAFPLTRNGKVNRRALPAPERVLLRKEIVSPRSITERRLAAIWKELLQVRLVCVTDNFFDIGGDSLLVAKLAVRIDQVFNRQVSMATMFQAPTIRQLAVHIENPAPSGFQMIPVQPAGSLPPFFCIGAGPLFRPLALGIGLDRPFLSLMPSLLPELKQLSAPYQLEKIAAHVVESILNYQSGPYYLGGWSDAGLVAYETARQLMEKGHEVALLVMFDTKNPAFQQQALKNVGFDSWTKKVKFLASELTVVRLKSTPAYASEKLTELRWKIKRSALRVKHKIRFQMGCRPAESPQQIVQLAVNSYRPAPYVGRLVFFKAADRPRGDAWDFSRGWYHLACGEFEEHEVPGDHRSMFVDTNVETLASHLRRCFSSNNKEFAALDPDEA